MASLSHSDFKTVQSLYPIQFSHLMIMWLTYVYLLHFYFKLGFIKITWEWTYLWLIFNTSFNFRALLHHDQSGDFMVYAMAGNICLAGRSLGHTWINKKYSGSGLGLLVPRGQDMSQTWKNFPTNWTFIRAIYLSLVDSPYKAWVMWNWFLLLSAITNFWINSWVACDLKG